jgi:hypothetical protein
VWPERYVKNDVEEDFDVVLRQRTPSSEVVHASRSSVVIVPPEFDLLQPFDVELTLASPFISSEDDRRVGLFARRL